MANHGHVLVVGAGLEGLAAAATLARGGARVTLVDSVSAAGGVAAGEEFHPGYTSPGLLPEVGCVRRELLSGLELESHGLRWQAGEAPLLVPAEGEAGLLLHHAPGPLRSELAPQDAPQAEAYERFRHWIEQVRPFVLGILDAPPPILVNPGVGAMLDLGKTALRLRRMGERQMVDLLRVAPMCAQDWLKEWFDDEALCTGLVTPALHGTLLGPRAAGTAALVLLRECARGPEPVGGAAALAKALEESCRKQGVELVLGRELDQLVFEKGAVRGIDLAGGERLDANTVFLATDARRAVMQLTPTRARAAAIERTARHWRVRGSTAIVRLALSAPPAFPGREHKTIERCLGVRSFRQLERAMDAIKYRSLPEQPILDVSIPSVSAPELAPEGHATVVVQVLGVPSEPDGGWTAARRDELFDKVCASLGRLAPGLSETLVGHDVLTPPELEQRFGLTGGHLFGGELALDQLWIQRPSLDLSRYSTTWKGVWLGGSGSHPGGPFHGGAGVLAARALLRG